jgi:AraC-like DNA-binding protein
MNKHDNSFWPEIYTIGNKCIERYVHSIEPEHSLADQEIIASGMSDLIGTYVISRSSFVGHIINFTIDGSGKFTTPDQTHILTPGDIFVVPAGHKCRYERQSTVWKTIWFDLYDSEKWSWIKDQKAGVHKVKNLDDIKRTMVALHREIHSKELGSKEVSTLLSEQLTVYLRRELDFHVQDYENSIVQRLRSLFLLVNRSLQADWNVDKLAHEMAVSPSHLYSLCREYLGINPMKHVTQLRMSRAKLLLYQTNAPIADVGEAVGYSNQFNFSSAFKKVVGESPTQYRKKKR